MHIFIPPGGPMDGSAYLAEILHAFGLCFAERVSLRDALKAANPRADVILLPHGSESAGIESFLQDGGSVVAIRPDETIERLAGLHRKGEHEGPSRLRLVQPICYGARGESLWTLGPITEYENNPGPHVAGYLFRSGDAESESLGIVEGSPGSGRLTVCAYDPVMCIARLRQGYPERAGFLPPGEKKPRSIYLHKPQPPADTLWRPTADFHGMVLCEIIKRLLARHAPVPTLWHIPHGRPSILLFSGDEDVGAQEANHQQMSDLESVDGSMSLYVIADDTSITRERIEAYTQRGHSISVHPNLVPMAGQPVDVQLARAEQQVRLFQEKFQRRVHTVRNHNYGWPGYLDLPELWERLGIGMDANTCAYLYRQSPDGGPFANVHASMPLPFVREDGSLIDVYQQATHINDDIWFHSTVFYSQKFSPEQFDWIAQRICDDAARWFHAPVCANIHPVNYVSYSGAQARALMSRAREFDMPIWSLDRWHDFWRARATWKMDRLAWNGSRLTFSLKGSSCEALWLVLPTAVHDGPGLRTLKLDGVPTKFEKVQRNGVPVIQAPLPSGSSEIEVVGDYE